MKRQFLCVEIPRRRPFQGGNASRHKKRKLGLPQSPTVSDFEEAQKEILPLRRSSTSSITSESDKDLNAVASGSNITLQNLQGPVLYETSVDDVSESLELILPGETPPDEQTSPDGLPVRLLDDFTVFHASSNEIIPFGHLLQLEFNKGNFTASGLAFGWVNEEEDEPEDEGGDVLQPQRLQLSAVTEICVHDISESTGEPDSKIWIRTAFAWYILDRPSEQYRPYFLPFWIKHRSLHMVLDNILSDRHTSYDELVTSLSDTAGESCTREAVLTSLRVLGRVLTEDDIQSDEVKAYIIGHLPDFLDDYGLSVKSVRLATDYLELDDYDNSESTRTKRSKKSFSRQTKKSVLSDEEKEILKHRATTYVTPLVSQIMKKLFTIPLDFADIPVIKDDPDVVTDIDNIKTHHSDPLSMQWGDTNEDDNMYSSVVMDGVEYMASHPIYVGDDVMVVPGDDENMKRASISKMGASQSPNSYANNLWFCKICYFFETTQNGKKVKMFHGHWFIHGSKTILQETAHSKSLYLLMSCEDNPVASIYKKCKITMIGPDGVEPPDEGEPDTNDFHCALAYDEKETCFTDLPSEDKMAELLKNTQKPCISCAVQEHKENEEEVTVSADGFSMHGINYHCLDFIYLRSPEQTSGLLKFAQIMKIKVNPKSGDFGLTVRMFKRSKRQDHPRLGLPWDERRLYFTDTEQVIDDGDLIDGKCFIKQLADIEDINDWVRHDDHFYVNQGVDIETRELYDLDDDALEECDICESQRRRTWKEQQKLLARNGPIRCLELFSGAGGLGTGLDLSGFVETKYAVEFSPSAAATYAKNHPHATVYCQDSNMLLKQAYEASKGETPKALKSGIDGTFLPPMPRRGEIDMISGGNMLGYVETYDPQYFLLENVVGLVSHPLLSTLGADKRSLQGGIKAGMVKFIMRTLIALGYQVRFKILQAGLYGAPQSRRRVIFLGAKRGITLPDFPLPTYAFEKGMNRSHLPTGTLEPVSRGKNINHQCAPLQPVTVNDAVGDLPPFDWVNPHKKIAATSKDKKAVKRRIEDDIPQFPAVLNPHMRFTLPGFPNGVDYLTQPLNRYQMWLRRGMKDREKVQGHYTRFFTAAVVEASKNASELPKSLRSAHMSTSSKTSFYGRLDGDAQFKCAMTTASPNSKEGWLLHPDQIRQIGNAVPVPLALQLGKALGAASLKDWDKDRERREREGSVEY
ncbi:hypothetical protein H0H93_011741 [Arthromyces matolae]|nr:hypothetical protein H0H93_011741 [Arthromyces matolae]